MKEGTKYMITNTLEIYASSEAIKALITLNIIRAERVGDLDTMPVSVVTAEVLVSIRLKQLFILMQLFFICTIFQDICLEKSCRCFLMGFVTGLTAIEEVLYFHKRAERCVRQVLCQC